MKKLIMLILPVLLFSACVVVPGKRAKAGDDTALVCHKGKKTLRLPQAAVKAHLKHGDKLGPC